LQEVAVAEVTNELLYEILKAVQASVRKVEDGLSEVKQELIAIRGTMVAMQQDINNIYAILARHDERLDRIDRRIELRELAEAQKAFDPSS
jgi:translation initiation factor 2B subunit (eIF-2B alpha/beta/delta family)